MKYLAAIALAVSAGMNGTCAAQEIGFDDLAFESAVFAVDESAMMIDRGAISVPGNSVSARTETFAILAKPDGGFSILSETVQADGAYRTKSRWDYGVGWVATRAYGIGIATEGQIVRKAIIARRGDLVEMIRQTIPDKGESDERSWRVECGSECMFDLSPSILPMTIMGQRFDLNGPKTQAFRWTGISLTQDSVLTDGIARLSATHEVAIARSTGETPLFVRHFTFVEELKDAISGRTGRMIGHFWNDNRGFVRKFGMGRGESPTTIGVRAGDESIAARMTIQ